MGSWSYGYNVLGELTSQTNAKSQTTTLSYDTLGRLTSRVEAEGTTTWTYDSATKGVGKLAQVSGPSYLRVESYDSLGRPSSSTETIDGKSFTLTLGYDSAGRAADLTYPTGFQTTSEYTPRGHLKRVKDAGSAVVFWEAETVNAAGQVTQETLGNGIVTDRTFDPETGLLTATDSSSGTTVQNLTFVFDLVGNLTEREDLIQQREETFLYDDLNRVTQTTLTDTQNSTTLATTTTAYDSLGNITNKSDVGAYTYGQNGAGPHAVTTAGSETYAYDDNGNMKVVIVVASISDTKM